jgi:hypothetical protein
MGTMLFKLFKYIFYLSAVNQPIMYIRRKTFSKNSPLTLSTLSWLRIGLQSPPFAPQRTASSFYLSAVNQPMTYIKRETFSISSPDTLSTLSLVWCRSSVTAVNGQTQGILASSNEV